MTKVNLDVWFPVLAFSWQEIFPFFVPQCQNLNMNHKRPLRRVISDLSQELCFVHISNLNISHELNHFKTNCFVSAILVSDFFCEVFGSGGPTQKGGRKPGRRPKSKTRPLIWLTENKVQNMERSNPEYKKAQNTRRHNKGSWESKNSRRTTREDYGH